MLFIAFKTEKRKAFLPMKKAVLEHLQLRFSTFQPQSHFHLPHQRDAFVEMLLRQWQITASPIKFSKTNVAMRNERSHAEFFSEGESLAIVVFRLPDIRRIFARCDLAEQPKNVRLVSSLFVLTGEIKRASGVYDCVLNAPRQ